VEHKFTLKNPRNKILDLQKKLYTEEQNITIAEQKYKYMWNTNSPMKDHGTKF
jgi:hypothetical protein